MAGRILFLGGNGHCGVRLHAARAALAELGDPFELVDVLYPGFEGRPRVDTFDAFLDAIVEFLKPRLGGSLIYATGIGGLLALSLRARGELSQTPILMQGPVLWGLINRWFPWLMRRGLWRLFPYILRGRKFQRRIRHSKFTHQPSVEFMTAFFDGYRACSAATDFFQWLAPDLLRRLEEEFQMRPEALERISIWWGQRDAVVSLDELRVTEKALNVTWPVTTFPAWGHYPMIDAPVDWVRELSHVVAAAR